MLFDDAAHFCNSLFKTDEKGSGDNGESDGHLRDVRYGTAEVGVVVDVQTVPGMYGKAQIMRQPGCPDHVGKHRGTGSGIGSICIVTRVQFDGIGTNLGTCADLIVHRIHKEGHLFDSAPVQARDYLLKACSLCQNVEPPLGGDFFPALGNQRSQLGRKFAAYTDDFRGKGKLEIQLGIEFVCKAANISILDVTPILSQMEDYPIGSARKAGPRRLEGIGECLAPRISKRSNMVDVDEQFGHIPADSCRSVRWCICDRDTYERQIKPPEALNVLSVLCEARGFCI